MFTHPYTDLSLIDFINPTIVTSGNWLKNRSYHKVVTDADNNAPEVPIYAPSDARAIGITFYLAPMLLWDGTTIELGQYDVRFQASCEVAYWFDHISRLAEPFASLAPLEPARDTRNAQVPVNVEVQAGDLIGYSSGTEPAHVWDFVLTNSTVTAAFVNQERYEQTGDLEHLLHTDCPSGYFTPVLQEQYAALLGAWQGRVEGYGCGGPVDALGTIAGGWFQTPFESGNPFAPADWGVAVKVAADGYLDINGPGASVRTAPGSTSFADPKTVTTEHCYEHYQPTPGSFAFLKLLSNDTLAAVFGQGPCPSQFPGDFTTYYR